MSLFSKKKKEPCCSNESPSCGPSCGPNGCCDDPSPCGPSCGPNGCCEPTVENTSPIIVLGACCQKSTDTFANVEQAVEEMGLARQVINIGDPVEIAKYGVMQTPALVIDGKVLSLGKLIKVDEAKHLIEKVKG